MALKYKAGPNAFKNALHERVRAYLAEQPNGRFAGRITRLKCTIIAIALVGVYAMILTSPGGVVVPVALAISLGLLQLMLVFNVGHDAAHGSFSARRWGNTLLRYSWEIAGISSYSWSLRHNVAHHGFTNVIGVDLDIEQGFFLRLNPGEKRRWFHRFQHIYAPIIYSLFTFYLATIRDFQILRRARFGNRNIAHHPRRAWTEVLVGKALYYTYIFVIPLVVTDFTFWQILLGFMLLHIVAGSITMILAAPPHLAVGNILEPAPADGRFPRSFAEHQLLSTADMAPRSRLLIAFCGGLNAQVVHHLFPGIAHTHHRALTPIVEQVAKDHGLTYSSRSVWGAVRAHYRHLRLMGRPGPADGEQRVPARGLRCADAR